MLVLMCACVCVAAEEIEEATQARKEAQISLLDAESAAQSANEAEMAAKRKWEAAKYALLAFISWMQLIGPLLLVISPGCSWHAHLNFQFISRIVGRAGYNGRKAID